MFLLFYCNLSSVEASNISPVATRSNAFCSRSLLTQNKRTLHTKTQLVKRRHWTIPCINWFPHVKLFLVDLIAAFTQSIHSQYNLVSPGRIQFMPKRKGRQDPNAQAILQHSHLFPLEVQRDDRFPFAFVSLNRTVLLNPRLRFIYYVN